MTAREEVLREVRERLTEQQTATVEQIMDYGFLTAGFDREEDYKLWSDLEQLRKATLDRRKASAELVGLLPTAVDQLADRLVGFIEGGEQQTQTAVRIAAVLEDLERLLADRQPLVEKVEDSRPGERFVPTTRTENGSAIGHEDLPAVDGQVLDTPDAVVKTVRGGTDTSPCGRVGESAGGVKFPPALDGIQFASDLEDRRKALGLMVDAYNTLEAQAGANDFAVVAFMPESGDIA